MDRARRACPSANAIITEQWNMHCMDMHKKKLSKVKSRIDNKPPRKASHLKRNRKREQMREERYSAIERDNRILLEKMAAILRSNSTLDTIRTYKARSLNRHTRRKELIRITKENQGILRRIQASEPTYNHVAWEMDRKAAEKRIANISLYDRKTGASKVTQHIKSRQNLHRKRPTSAPAYRRGAAGTRRRARPSSAMPRMREEQQYAASSSDRSSVGERRQRPASATARAGRPQSAGRHRPQSAGRHRPASASRGRPTSAARQRGGEPEMFGGYSALSDLDLQPGQLLEADDEESKGVDDFDFDDYK